MRIALLSTGLFVAGALVCAALFVANAFYGLSTDRMSTLLGYLSPLYGGLALSGIYGFLYLLFRRGTERAESQSPTGQALVGVGLRHTPMVILIALGALLLPLAIPFVRRGSALRFVGFATGFWVLPTALLLGAAGYYRMKRFGGEETRHQVEAAFKRVYTAPLSEQCARCREGAKLNDALFAETGEKFYGVPRVCERCR